MKYFGSIPHSHLRSFLDRRVTDGVIRRMIDKWLKAGVLEDGLLRHATEGSPQGGVISPASWCVRTSLTLPAGESPAPARGMSRPTGNRALGSWR
jgi:retron-type reverse transcriptase